MNLESKLGWHRLGVCLRNILLLTAVMLLALACVQPAQDAAEHGVQIALMPAPEGKDGNYLVVMLHDEADQPITDAVVALEGDMNHAGMVPVIADPVTDDVDGNSDGHYHLPFAFSMMGDWIITVSVTLADGTEIEHSIDLTVSDEGITVAGEMMADHVMDEHVMGDDDGMDGHLMVMNAMAGANPLEGGNGAVYLTLMNHTDQDDTLIAVESPAAPAVELHESVDDNGVMRMMPQPDGFTIPAGGSIELAPGGKHIMLVGLAGPLVEGEEIDVTLRFERADPMTITVPILAMTEMHQHGND